MKRRQAIKLCGLGAAGLALPARGQFNLSDLALVGNAAASAGGVDPAVTAWASQVVTNGGAAVSAPTIAAMDTFYKGLVSKSLLSLMVSVNGLVPDSLIAARTPLIAAAGSVLWGVTGFVAGDLTVNGLLANGSKWLDTGVIPSTAFADNASAGISLFNVTNAAQSVNDAGIWDATIGNAQFGIYLSYNNVAYFDCWNSGSGTGRYYATNSSNYSGFISFNRTSLSVSAVYKGRGGSMAALTGGSGGGAAGTRPTCSIYIFASQKAAVLGTAQAPDSRQFSFAAIHKGLTLAQATDFYTLALALRTSLGGGTV